MKVYLVALILTCVASAQISDTNRSTQPYSNSTIVSVTFKDPSKESNDGTYCQYDPSGAGDNFNIQITSPPNDTYCFGPGALFSANDTNDNFPADAPTPRNNTLAYEVIGAENFNSSADYSQLQFRQGDSVSAKQDAMMGALVFQVYQSEDCSDEVGQRTSWIWSCDSARPSCDTVPYRMRSFSVRTKTAEEARNDRPGTCGNGNGYGYGVSGGAAGARPGSYVVALIGIVVGVGCSLL